MTNHSTEKWSLGVGRWRNVDIRLHIALPMMSLSALVVLMANFYQPWVALWAVGVLVISVALHELARVATAYRVGGHANSLVLGPVGGWTKLHLPVDPPAHLLTALAGPMTYFVLLVASGCGLALAGDRHIHFLLNPIAPQIDVSFKATTLHTVGQLFVWINWCLLVIDLMPIDPCAGAQMMRGVLWPIVGRASATVATSHIALVAGAILALFSVFIFQQEGDLLSSKILMPPWFPLACASVFLIFGGKRNPNSRYYDVANTIEEFDSDDEEWLMNEWQEDDREAVLVEHLQDKKQEVIDRKRREREANEDARVDAILVRLRDSTFEQLSEEERAILKRASRRYRQRRDRGDED